MIELPSKVEPVDGSRVRIRVDVDGVPLVDTDLTRAWLRSRYGGDTLVPLYFTPFVLPADDGEAAAPAEPVMAALRLTPVDLVPAFVRENPWPYDVLKSIKLTTRTLS